MKRSELKEIIKQVIKEDVSSTFTARGQEFNNIVYKDYMNGEADIFVNNKKIISIKYDPNKTGEMGDAAITKIDGDTKKAVAVLMDMLMKYGKEK